MIAQARNYRLKVVRTRIFTAFLILLLLMVNQPAAAGAPGNAQQRPLISLQASHTVYLPLVEKLAHSIPLVNMPYFSGTNVTDANYHQSAVAWFGRVGENNNYTDMRIGYNDKEMYVRLSVIDRHRILNPSPSPTPAFNNLTAWDSISLYLDMDGSTSRTLDASMYRFTAQVGTKPDRQDLQTVYRGSSQGWNPAPLPFFTSSGWLGGGYVLTFFINFEDFGIPAPPAKGTQWGMAVTLHDRDNASGTLRAETHWPQDFDPQNSATWSRSRFGLPENTPQAVQNPQEFTIRHGVNGAVVKDGVVGGSTICGAGLEFWNVWGNHSYPGVHDLNVQNQGNIDDWPCYSKFYITFPLDSLPVGKTVSSATLTMHQSGQSTGFAWDPPAAQNSLIQVLEVRQNWEESTLTWNTAPLPVENIAQSWAGPVTMQNWGAARTWDLSRAAARAYAAGQPLRIALYSADAYGPNGKYLLSSEAAVDWRPSLKIVLGGP